MKNDCLDAAVAVLEEHGIRDVLIAHGGKHPQLQFHVNGGPLRVFAICGTASDWRSPQNTKRDLRKFLRENGITTEQERPEPPARKPSRLELLERRVGVQEQTIELLERRIAVLEQAEQT
jgi:hypothetical protein